MATEFDGSNRPVTRGEIANGIAQILTSPKAVLQAVLAGDLEALVLFIAKLFGWFVA